MTGRSRLLTAILAVLIVVISVTAAGCAARPDAFTRMGDGRLSFTEGSDVWILDNRANPERITLNDKPFAEIQNGIAQISLSDSRSLDVVLDGHGKPLSIRAAWNTKLMPEDYALMNTAFNKRNEIGSQGQSGPLGWVIFLLLVIIAGVLLFIYAGHLVNSWKLGGIFSGHDTAKSLLIFKALGILLMVIGFILLLVVIF